jgi:hypothetical protein
MEMTKDILGRFRSGLRNAFSLESPHGPLTEDDLQLLAKLAGAIVSRGMAVPAVLFLGSVRPLNSIGSQALVFLRPFLSGPFHGADYDRMTAILDRREGIGALVEAIEEADTMKKGPTK